MFSGKKLGKSIKYSLQGLSYIIEREQNFRIQLIISVVTLFFSFYFRISRYEWIVIILMITAVLILEIVNSALEQLVDIMKPRLHGHVRLVKDMLAGAVFVTALCSIIIGLMIFYPHIVEIF